MNEYFVDTNVFLRFLLRDNKKQSKLAEELFEKCEQDRLSLWTTDVVILEIVWVLKSFYKASKKEIQESMSQLFAIKNLTIKNSEMLLQSLDDFVSKNVDFADAYNFQLAKKESKKVLSFDTTDFKKLGVKTDIKKIIK